MPYKLQGGNAASSDYDYQTGSGIDSFLSRSLDEVSWQSQLGSFYNSLTELPIGTMPTTATPTNYDATQISGSQSGSSTLGGSTGGSAAGVPGGATAGISFNSGTGNNNIEVADGSNNRVLVGFNPATRSWGIFATPPGTDIGNATTPQQLALTTDYSSLAIVVNQTITFNPIVGSGSTGLWQTYTIPHGQPNIPTYLPYVSVSGFGIGIAANSLGLPPGIIYTLMTSNYETIDSNLTSYQYFSGIDETNIYLTRLIINTGPFTAVPASVTYQILQQTATSNNLAPVAQYATGTYAIE